MSATILHPNLAMRSVAPWLNTHAIDHGALGHTISCLSERVLNEHEHLFMEGEKQTHIYLVLEGVVGMYKLLSDGRRQISTFAYPGDIIGLDCSGSHVNNSEALSPSVVRCIPLNAIDKLIRSEPGFGQALLRLAASELAEAREQMLSLGRKSAAEKLATFLVRIARRGAAIGQADDTIQIPMNRCEIADFLGLTIETVSRNFTKLKVSRVIRLKSNSEIEILNPAMLEAIADGTDTSLVQ